MKKILVIDGHPWKDSLCASFATSYVKSAKYAGADVRLLKLRELEFNPLLERSQDPLLPLEPAIKESQELIHWADRMVFIYPTWWTNMPALLKGWIDVVFLSGVTYQYDGESPLPIQLLKGKTARLLITMDAPGWYNRWIQGQAQTQAMRKGTLMFCGVKPVQINIFGSVKGSSDEKRKDWLSKVGRLAIKDTS